MPVNGQYDDPPFGMSAGIAHTGSPGTAAPGAGGTAGVPLGTVTVTTPYSSSQAPQPQVTVTSGDTCSYSDDTPVHAGPTLPGPVAGYMATGAGDGRVHAPRPGSPS